MVGATSVFIGDRGSGKSTALGLLTLLSDSTTEHTGVLVNAVLDLLRGELETVSSRDRRIWKTLAQFGIQRYACYFQQKTELYTFFVETEKGYDLLHRQDSGWSSVENVPERLGPEVQVFRQGEVFRIAEDQEHLVLNNILDGLYPQLYTRRKALASQLVDLARQYSSLEIQFVGATNDIHLVDRFINRHLKDLVDLKRNAQRSENIPDVLDTLDSYLYEYNLVDVALPRYPIVDLVRTGDPGLICLYVGRIARFLTERIQEVRKLLELRKVRCRTCSIASLR